MSIFQSLNIGVAGLQAQSNVLGVISDNLANINTGNKDTQDKIDNEAFLLKFNLKCLMLLYVILVVDLFVHYFIG